ncbi:J domain-containing protein [Neomegalonema perideroedes]|uniref:J domain-containing protein n=1 Tax=Neomegalonema perideroedes TaxID=217219 RepID=UPI0003763C9E|nr:J domain-containing protein [Neomegalonema perideroedes]
MSGGTVYQRAAKRHAVLIEHLSGDATEGFLLVPIGVALEQYIHQIEHVFPLEALDGRRLYVAMSGVKFIAPREDEGAPPPPPPSAREAMRDPPPPKPSAASRSPEENAAVARRFQSVDAEAVRRREQAARELVERQRRERQKRVADERRRRREEDPDAVAAVNLLSVPIDAPIEEVQSAYRREVKIYHPDRLRGFGAPEEDIARAHERLTVLNRAYQVLAALETEGAEEGEPSAAPS